MVGGWGKEKFPGENKPLEPVCGGFQGGFFCGVGGGMDNCLYRFT